MEPQRWRDRQLVDLAVGRSAEEAQPRRVVHAVGGSDDTKAELFLLPGGSDVEPKKRHPPGADGAVSVIGKSELRRRVIGRPSDEADHSSGLVRTGNISANSTGARDRLIQRGCVAQQV